MKRWVLYVAAIGCVVLFQISPFRGTDIAKLAPVEVVWLTEKNGQVYLQTDTGDMGWGEDVQAALRDMKAAAPGTVFLETADYLIVKKGREDLLEQVYDVLRQSCMVCMADEMPDMESVAAFLEAHEPQMTLRQYRADQRSLPLLKGQDGRFEWIAQ